MSPTGGVRDGWGVDDEESLPDELFSGTSVTKVGDGGCVAAASVEAVGGVMTALGVSGG